MADVTINDIAKQAHVSPAAVSYVLNDRPGVSEKTRETILRIIKETGYTPNLSSRKLKLHRSFNIHVVIGSVHVSFDDLFYNAAIERMLDVCNENGYTLVLSSTHRFEQSTLCRAIQQKDVDGVVFLQDVVEEAVDMLREQQIPYVVLDAHDLSNAHNCVYCNYSEATYTATAHLLAHGHRTVGFIGPDRIAAFYDSARAGYVRALVEGGVAPDAAIICRSTEERDIAPETVDALLAAAPTAVVCATDMLAVSLMQQLTARGVRVPQEISVCGIDDILLARYCTPALTTVEVDKRSMGETAIRMLLDILDKKRPRTAGRICVHSTALVQRDSVVPAP